MAKFRVKKGDTVVVISGKDKGATGKVITVLPREERVIVEGVNLVKKHTKIGQTSRGGKTGGIVTQEAAIHVSNPARITPRCDSPCRRRAEVVITASAPAIRYFTTSVAPWTPVDAASEQRTCPYRTEIHSNGSRISDCWLSSSLDSTTRFSISKSG